MCHMFRTKTGIALIIKVNDRYKVALAISLILKVPNIFLDQKLVSKIVQNWNFREKSEKSGNFTKTFIFIFNVLQT